MGIGNIQAYLFFNGRCDEAIAFYKTALGAEVITLMRFKDNPDRPPPEAVPRSLDDKVMHASIKVGASEIMLSDGMTQGRLGFKGVSLTLPVREETEADRLFNALKKGGKVQMPIGKTFFSPRFGVVRDRFGVSWMILTEPQVETANPPR